MLQRYAVIARTFSVLQLCYEKIVETKMTVVNRSLMTNVTERTKVR